MKSTKSNRFRSKVQAEKEKLGQSLAASAVFLTLSETCKGTAARLYRQPVVDLWLNLHAWNTARREPGCSMVEISKAAPEHLKLLLKFSPTSEWAHHLNPT